MKKNLLFILLLTWGWAAHGYTIDPVSTANDSSGLKIDYLLYAASIPGETEMPTFTQVAEKRTAMQASWLGRIVQKVGNAIGDAFDYMLNGFGQYTEDGMNTEGPYFMFDRHSGGSVPEQLVRLRTMIIDKQHNYHLIYKDIFNEAGTTTIYNCPISDIWDYTIYNEGQFVCSAARRAKASAFVYLVGLDTNGLAIPQAPRVAYRNRAIDFIKRVDPPYLMDLNDITGSLPLPIISNLIFASAGVGDRDGMQYRSKELLMLVEAIDMIVWSKNIDPAIAWEAPTRGMVDDMCERVIKHYVVPMHRRCQNFHYFYHNNLTLIPAAALGAAAIEFRKYGSNALSFSKWPKRWANSANYNIHNTMWRDGHLINGHMTKSGTDGDGYGYTEGPHYFRYGFESLLPYFKARYNFSNHDKAVPYYSFVWDMAPAYVRNFYFDPDYDRLYKWYNNIIQPDGSAPALDDTYHKSRFNGVLALRGKPSPSTPAYNFITDIEKMGLIGPTGLSNRENYICALQPPVEYDLSSLHMKGGYTVVRGQDSADNNHYILGLTKNHQNAHTHHDAGSIVVTADEEVLIMDPPYFDYGNREHINEYKHHNTMYMNYKNFHVVREPGDIRITPGSVNSKDVSFTMRLRYGISDAGTLPWTRTINVYQNDPVFGYYYIMTDVVENDNNGVKKFLLNGNGDATDIYPSYRTDANGFYIWEWPCKTGKEWGIKAAVSASVPPSDLSFETASFLHGNDAGATLTGRIEETRKGRHTQLITKVDTDSSKFSVITYLIPTKCVQGSAQRVAQRTNWNYGLISINSGNNYDEYRVHISKHQNTTDTIIDPMGLDPAAVLKTDGLGAYLGYNLDSAFRSRYCLSYANIRRMGITQGKSLEYNGTPLITCDSNVSMTCVLSGKFKYTGFATTTTASGITVYMPDMEMNYAMVARNARTMQVIPSEHHDSLAGGFKYIRISFPAGTTDFILELADPCRMSCFFPPTNDSIVDRFDFAEGSTETLGHNLDIVPDSGWLNIVNGSKMSICPNYYLYNRDSITLGATVKVGEPGEFPMWAPEGDLPGGGTGITDTSYLKRLGSGRSMIIVNRLAALILDSGSYTHVGSGSTVLIRKGGTLLVKKGATVEIGSPNSANFGEVIVEPGAYVCIEDSSDLHFFNNSPDTNEINVFFVPVDKGVNSGVNTSAINKAFIKGRFEEGFDCIPLCSLWRRLPEDGVNNPEFGHNTLGKPYAFFSNLQDTMCSIDTIVYINAQRSRNETKYRIAVTRIGLPDSMYFRQQAYDYQQLTHHETIDLSPLGTYSGTLRFRLTVENICGDSDVYEKLVYIPPPPYAFFTLDKDSVCPGYGGLFADGSSSLTGGDSIRHTWTVSLIDTVQRSAADTNALMYSRSWQYTTLNVEDSFNFPGFQWFGGFRYAVSLTVYDICGNEVQYTDTVSVPLTVYAWLDVRPGAYHNPLGPSAIQLHGVVNGATSWSWSPGTYLNSAFLLNPLAMPENDITYVLTGSHGSCIARDSIQIKAKNLIYAGDDRVICAGNRTILGPQYLLAALIAMSAGQHYIYMDALSACNQRELSALLIEQYLLEEPQYATCGSLQYLSSDQSDFITRLLSFPPFIEYFDQYLADPLAPDLYSSIYNEMMNDPYFSSILTSVDNDYCFGEFLAGLMEKYQTCNSYYQVQIGKPAALFLGAMYAADPIEFEHMFTHLNNEYKFPAYLDAFLQSTHFASMYCMGITEILSYYDEWIYDVPEFASYYNEIGQSQTNTGAFNTFMNEFMTPYGNDLVYDMTGKGFSTDCYYEFRSVYIDWLNSQYPQCFSPKMIFWEYNEGSQWDYNLAWNGQYHILAQPGVDTKYRITVVDIANNTVEYDIVSVSLENPPAPFFGVTSQTYTTAGFSNYTTAANPSAVEYLWTFGDGSSSTAINPVHTFPAFDSAYYVCLSVKHSCGTFQYCDTIKIDSNTLSFFSFGKRGATVDNTDLQRSKPDAKPVILKDKNILGANRPNPFDNTTSIDFELVKDYKNAYLSVTNTLGQEVQKVMIPAVKGTIILTNDNLKAGMYYYALIVDGVISGAKTMIVK